MVNDSSLEIIKKRMEFLESILDDSHDVIIAGDTDGKIVEFNKGAEILLGYKKDEVLGKSIDLLYFNPPDRRRVIKLLEEKGVVVDYDIKGRNKTGQLVHLSTTLSYLRDNHDHIIGTIGIAKDIRKRKEWEKKQARKMFVNTAVVVVLVAGAILITYGLVAGVKSSRPGRTPLTENNLVPLRTELAQLRENLAKTQQDTIRLKTEKESEVSRLAQQLTMMQKEIDNINQCAIYLPRSAVDKTVVVLKKGSYFSPMWTTMYWKGKLKEVKPDRIVIIEDGTNKAVEIPMQEIGGYKIE